MKTYLFIIILILLVNPPSNADHDSFPYGFSFFPKYKIEGSDQYRQFKTKLIKDKLIKKQIKNFKKTGLVSYIFYENGSITIDEKSPGYWPDGTKESERLFKSNSVGKSLTSYVIGHAICEGYVDGVNVVMNDWPIIKNTLYDGQKLIDVLNMTAGDQDYIGKRKFEKDDLLKGSAARSANLLALRYLMENNLQNTKKSKPVYNYSALATHVALNYTIFKTGKNYQNLLSKVFNEHVRVKNSVYFLRNSKDETIGSGRYTFFATRYDYLRIAQTIMEDWKNDTCVGKYLKSIYENRIDKNTKVTNRYNSIFSATKKYGGQFHFDVVGLEKKKIIGLDGLGGQQIIIDIDNNKIIVINSIYNHYNWKKIVYKKLKNK